MKITWLGHACIFLEGSRKVLIDPFTGGLPLPCDADVIAVTHGHADHMGEAAALGVPVVAMNEIAKYLGKSGVVAHGMNLGGRITEQGITFTMTPALHSSWLEEAGGGYSGGGAGGFVIEMDGIRVYHAGDTALFSDMKLIGELTKPHVACLPIGGRFTMGPEEAMIAAQFIGAPYIIPVHYNTWPPIVQDPSGMKLAIERTTHMKVLILAPGGSVTIIPEDNGSRVVQGNESV